jgi:hypothetical protein
MPKVTYRGFQIGGAGRDARIRDITGLFSRNMSANAPDLPRYHGSLIGASFEQKKTVRVGFAVAPERRLEMMGVLNPLIDSEEFASFEVEGYPPLLLGVRAVRCEIPVTEVAEHGYASGDVEFEATDPALYSEDLLQASLTPFVLSGGLSYPVTYPKVYGSAGSGGGVEVTNEGEWETWPTFEISAPSSGTGTNPIVENITTGKRIALNANGGVSMTSGQVLEISTHPARRHIRFTTGASRYGKQSPDSEFFPLEPGVNELRFRMSGTTTNAECGVSARSAWI